MTDVTDVVERSLSLYIQRDIPTTDALRRTQSLTFQNKDRDRKLLRYLNSEIGSKTEAKSILRGLTVSPIDRRFWFPDRDPSLDSFNDFNFQTRERIALEWTDKYDNLLELQNKQKDTKWMGMRRRIKKYCKKRDNETINEDDVLDIQYLKAWINGLSETEYTAENMEMNLVYGIDLQRFLNEIHKADTNKDGLLSHEEFIQMMTMYYNRNIYQQSSSWERAWNALAYADQLSCSPPPLVVIIICLFNVMIYLYGVIMHPEISVPFCSFWIYNPNRRYEIFRFLTSSFVHVEPIHLINNMILLILIGLPLEMSHSSWRIMIIYTLGSLTGALTASVAEKSHALAGASGGVSSLAAAHVSDIVLNWRIDTIIFRHRLKTNRPARVFKSESVRFGRLIIIGSMIFMDIYYCLRNRYGSKNDSGTSYISHVGGAVFGFLIGYLVLRAHSFRRYNRLIRTAMLITTLILFILMISDHIFNSQDFPIADHCDWTSFRNHCSEKCYVKRFPPPLLPCNITFC